MDSLLLNQFQVMVLSPCGKSNQFCITQSTDNVFCGFSLCVCVCVNTNNGLC
jgi:hypothetical protein